VVTVSDPDFLSGTDILAIVGHLPVLSAIVSLRMRRNGFFRASGLNSDTALGFGDADFPKHLKRDVSSVFTARPHFSQCRAL